MIIYWKKYIYLKHLIIKKNCKTLKMNTKKINRNNYILKNSFDMLKHLFSKIFGAINLKNEKNFSASLQTN